MRVDAPTNNLVNTLQLQQQQREGLRVLEGNPISLNLGERLNATVIQTSSAGTLLNLKGTRILVDALPEFIQPGSDVMLRVAGMFPEPLLEMDTSNQQPGSLATGGQPLLEVQAAPGETALQLPLLEVGQQVTARVQGPLSGDRLLVDLKGTLLEATLRGNLSEAVARGELQAGAELPLRVEQLQPQVVFRILAQGQQVEGEAVQVLRQNLAERIPVSEALQGLQQALTAEGALSAEGGPLTLAPSLAKLQALIEKLMPGENPPNLEQIASFVRDSGLLYEAKLAQVVESNPRLLVADKAIGQALNRIAQSDLKGQLLETLKNIETELRSPAPKLDSAGAQVLKMYDQLQQSPARSLAEPVVNLLNHIETQQAVNLLAQLHGEPYLLQIPFFNGQGLSTAFLSIEPDRQGQGRDCEQGGQGYNVLFQLDLEQLGQTRIDAHFGPGSARVIFYAERGEALTRLRNDLPAFRQTLLTLGYNEVLLAANPLGQLAPEKREKFHSLAAGVPASVSLVDVRA